jgi:hypothetical protein
MVRLLPLVWLVFVCGAAAVAAQPTPDDVAGSPSRVSLSRASIVATIRADLDRVRACYERELAVTSELSGRLIVQFIIQTDGTVIRAHILDNALTPAGEGADRVAGCIVDVVRSLRFEAPSGHGVVGVNYPFVLDSTEPDAGLAPSAH